MKKIINVLLGILLLAFATTQMGWAEEYLKPARDGSGLIGGRGGEAWRMLISESIEFSEIAALDTPPTGHWGLYCTSVGIFIEDDTGAAVQLGIAGVTAWDDLIVPDNDESLDMTTFVTVWDFGGVADMFTLEFTGDFADVSGMVLHQKTGNPTDGTVLEVIAADDNVDPLVISASNKANALVVGQNTGVVTIAGVAEATSALIITAGDLLLTDGDIHVDAGDCLFDEDVTIGGWLNLTGDLVGGTGLINYTNFDVDALGNVSAVNGTFSGNVAITGTFQQNAITASTADTSLTVDGKGTGGVTIGATSNGNITLGDDVVVSDGYNVLIGEGSLTIDDDANETAMTITAAHTDTGSGLYIDSEATSGKGLSIVCDPLTSGAALYIDATEGGGFTGYYIQAYDGAANDFAVKRHGEIEITGSSTADMITISAGDLQIDDGIFEVDTDEDVTSYIERAQATVTGHVLSLIEQTDTAASSKSVLFIDQDTDSTPSSAIEIDTEGAYVMKVDALVAAGDGIYLDVADSYTGQWFIADAGPWLGTTSEGFWSFTSDAVATQEVGQVIQINLRGTGTAGTAVEGKALNAHTNAAVKAGESLVFLDTLTNTAIHIKNDGVAADGIKIEAKDAYTGQGIVGDMGAWTGTVDEGFINLENDAAATAVVGQALRINLQDSLVDVTAISGKGLFVKEVSPAKSGTYVAHFESTNNGSAFFSGPVSLQAAGTLVGGSPIVLEGATADAHEVTLAITDPESDTTLTLPDSPASGNIASVLVTGTTTYTESAVATESIVNSDITLPAGHEAAGQCYKWIVSGAKTGANNTFAIRLDLDGNTALTLTASSAVAGDFFAEITCILVGASSQKIYGALYENGKSPVVDYATAVIDLSGAAVIGLDMTLANAGDEVKVETTHVTYNE